MEINPWTFKYSKDFEVIKFHQMQKDLNFFSLKKLKTFSKKWDLIHPDTTSIHAFEYATLESKIKLRNKLTAKYYLKHISTILNHAKATLPVLLENFEELNIESEFFDLIIDLLRHSGTRVEQKSLKIITYK